jgi:hypothetical protein
LPDVVIVGIGDEAEHHIDWRRKPDALFGENHAAILVSQAAQVMRLSLVAALRAAA